MWQDLDGTYDNFFLGPLGSKSLIVLPFRFSVCIQLVITCSKLTIETLEQGVKYVQS